MYNLKLNNYHLNPKSSNIYTPPEVSEFLFSLLKDKLAKETWIIDPGVGQGSLSNPWTQAGYRSWGIDIDPNSIANKLADFLTCEINNDLAGKSKLIICNPPFNGLKPKLAPELWLDKIIELFGKNVPIVFFVPAGFTLNLTLASERYLKFSEGIYPPIASRISLPRNIFKPVIFHSEILIFNIPNLQPHYFYQSNLT